MNARGALLISLSAVAVTAQDVCDKSLPSLPNHPLGYRQRGDRCEGIYAQPLAATPLQIASLTESFDDYDPAAGKHLHVVWTPPDAGVVRLRANGLEPRMYYRMDTIGSAATRSYIWPTGVLAALHIHRQAVGVLAWMQWDRDGLKQQHLHLPVRIGQGRETARSKSYRLVVLPGRRLSEVYVHLAPVKEGRLGTFLNNGKPLRYGQYPAERAIVVPVDAPKLPGIYYVEIGADLADGGVATTQLYFYHPGR